MRAAPLLLVLCGAALGPRAQAQVASKSDSAAEAYERAYPWIAHSSLDMFYQGSPAPGGQNPYQISAYQGITIQSLRFAWFHAGLRTRETMAPGFARPYREPALLKLMGTAEVLREYLYVFMAGNVPLASDHVSASDSALLYESISDYNVFPYPNFLSPQGIHVGAFGRYRFPWWDMMAGTSYARVGRFEPIKGESFYPAAYFDVFARALLEGGSARHRIEAKAVIYSDEATNLRIAAHREGSLWQARYGYLRFASGRSYQLGLGGAWKAGDRNRQLRISSNLAPTPADDNVQRAYAEMAVSFAPRPTWLARAHLLPKILFVADGPETGHEIEAGLSLALRVWKIHRLRVAATGVYGNFRDRDYIGFGGRAEFAFRHLGFQDLEDQGDAEGDR